MKVHQSKPSRSWRHHCCGINTSRFHCSCRSSFLCLLCTQLHVLDAHELMWHSQVKALTPANSLANATALYILRGVFNQVNCQQNSAGSSSSSSSCAHATHQVVGGLVQHQDVWVVPHSSTQHYLDLLASTQATHQRVRGELRLQAKVILRVCVFVKRAGAPHLHVG